MKALVKRALAGTPDQRADPPPVPEAVAAVLPTGSGATPAWRTLLAAGAVDLHRRAGFVPRAVTAIELPDPVPAGRKPWSASIRDVAGRILKIAERQDRHSLLRDLFTASENAMGAPSPEFQVELLKHARTVPELQPLVREHATPLMRRLAELEPSWRWISAGGGAAAALEGAKKAAALATELDEGKDADRLAALEAWLGLDREAARSRVTSGWKQESPDFRKRVLARFEATLTPADEPLLNLAATDRSEPVRIAATKLLAQVPGSELSKRMVERAVAIVRFESTGAKATKPGAIAAFIRQTMGIPSVTAKLEVDPPTETPADWKKDSLGVGLPKERGERSGTLAQLLGLAPPDTWTARFSAPPEALVAAIAEDSWQDAVLEGFTDATIRFKAEAWAAPLFDALRTRLTQRDVDPWLQARHHHGATAELLRLMPLEERQRRWLRLLEDQSLEDLTLFRDSACRSEFTWSESLSREWLERMAQYLDGRRKLSSRDYSSWGLLADIVRVSALRLAPTTLAEVESMGLKFDGPPSLDQYQLGRAIPQFRETIALRMTIRRELT
jgi:hypothetical protein